MKIIILSLYILFFSFVGVKKQVISPISVNASSYIVMNRTNREVLSGNNINLVRSVASISKIMTAIIALESNKLFDVITIDEETTKQEGSSLYLKKDMKITLLDLVYGLMLRSGNDAAFIIGKYLSETNLSFIEKMNIKANELGMKNSIFNNPSGLDIFDEGNKSSSYDMALLFSYAMENPIFEAIVSTKEYKTNNGTIWHNKNKLLNRYEHCDGGKTGYTTLAKRTLVTGARQGDFKLCVVTLNAGNDFNTHQDLYEYFFNKYTYVLFLKKGNNYIGTYAIKSEKDIGIMLEKNEISDKSYKIYRIDEEGNLLGIKYIDKNGLMQEVILS